MRTLGGRITPTNLVNLLNEVIPKKGLLIIAAESNVGKSALFRYQKGIGEPTTATLEKLAAYFKVSVGWLRGGIVEEYKLYSGNTTVKCDKCKENIAIAFSVERELGGTVLHLEPHDCCEKNYYTIEDIDKLASEVNHGNDNI